MNSQINNLMHGAIDVHCHGYPEISFNYQVRLEDEETAILAKKYNMRACVLKSHLWPTVGRVFHLRKKISDIDIIPSITLNLSSGGINPWAVEAAAQQGAKVVWMPTWSSVNDLKRNGMSSIMKTILPTFKNFGPENGLSIIDEQGKITSSTHDVLQVAKSYGMAVFTGHISPRESLVIAEEAGKIGLKKIVFGHPDSNSVGASIEDIREMAKKGAYVEFCALGTLPMFQRIHPRRIAEIIKELGADKCILSTDAFFTWTPPAPEMMRMFIACLLEAGLTEEEISMMVKTNPAKLLDIDLD